MRDSLRKLAFTAVSSSVQSRIVGRLSDLGWSPAHEALMKLWIRHFGVDMSEVDVPDGGFDSFNAFFTRRLKPGARPMADDPGAMVSPCDGAVQTAGEITSGMLFQAKGIDYRLSELLGEAEGQDGDAARFEGGHYLTIYLSPGDYHRVHFPVSGQVRAVRHIPGGLLSVSPGVLDLFNDVFCRNERVSGLIGTDDGYVGMVMVGATSVGRISLSFSQIVSNIGRNWGSSLFTEPIPCKRGSEYGVFNLGSTVIVLVEKDRWRPVHPGVGSRIRLGQAIFLKD